MVRIFVKRPTTTIVIVILMVILGIYSLPNIEMSLMPDVEFPTVMIMIPAYGMNPQEIEEEVISNIEKFLMTLPNVERLVSYSYSNYGMIVVNFSWGSDMKEVSLKLSEKLDAASFRLTSNIKPIVFEFSPEMMPVAVVAVSGPNWDEVYEATMKLKSSIERLKEVSYVMTMGLKKKEVQVKVDYKKLIKNGVGMSMVSSVISSSNYLLSAGIDFKDDKYYPVNVVSRFKELEDIKNLLLPKGSGFGVMFSRMLSGMNLSTFMGPSPTVRVGDVAEVEIGVSLGESGARLNGKDSAFLVIQKRSGYSIISACESVRKLLDSFSFKDTEVKMIMDQSEYMKDSLNTLKRNLFVGAIAVFFVLTIFLKDIRTVLLVFVSIPVSILFGFILMYFSGITINIMSLGGLALAVGMLIDNAIVVTESIYRKSEMKLKSFESAYKGAGEVGGAIVASTLTTISIFLPIAFMKGFAERMFQDMALAVTYTLLASLIISLTFVPAISQFLIRKSKPRMIALSLWYKKTLKSVLKHKGLVLSVVLVVLVISGLYLYKLGFTLMPSSSPLYFRVTFSLPLGTSPAKTERVIEEMERYFISKRDTWNIKYVYSSYGVEDERSIFMIDSGYEKGFVEVEFDKNKKIPDFDEVKISMERELFSKLTKEFPAIKLDVLTPMNFQREIFGKPVEVIVKGDDIEKLMNISKEIYERIKKLEFLRNIEAPSAQKIETYKVIPRYEMLSRKKLSPLQISAEIAAVYNKTKVGKMIYEGRLMDIVVYPENTENIPVEDILVFNPFGVGVKVSDVATVVKTDEPFVIVHRDGKKAVIISADVSGISQNKALSLLKKLFSNFKLPLGYELEIMGEVEVTQREVKQILIAILIGIAIMFVIMAGEFESFIQPFIIMFTIPLGIIGMALVYLFVQKPVNIVAMLGALMLFGIVVNNGIVMVNKINRLRREGSHLLDAVIEGAATRLRPILMTSLTTITALIPELVLGGTGREYHLPMAYTLIGGLGVSTFFTLFIIPILYTLFVRERN